VILPQLAVSLIFFYWPALQPCQQSFLVQDAFGLSTSCLFETMSVCCKRLNTTTRSASPSFSRHWWFFSLTLGLLLAVMAKPQHPRRPDLSHLPDRAVRGAPAVAACSSSSCSSPASHDRARPAAQRHRLESGAQRTHAMILVVIVAVWNQISYNFLFFSRRPAGDPQKRDRAAAIDGARPMRRFWTIIFPLLSPTTFFLIIVNITYVFFNPRHHRHRDRRRPNGATQTLVYKVFQDGRSAPISAARRRNR